MSNIFNIDKRADASDLLRWFFWLKNTLLFNYGAI